MGVYSESSCAKASGEWVLKRVKPVYTCYNHGRYTTVLSSSPCDYQRVMKCSLPIEQEQVAKNEVLKNSDLYSVLTQFD
jgi:hypothetical protein